MYSALSVAAQDLRYWKEHKTYDFDEEWTLNKMRTILYMAATHGHKAIVLGALGCGAFQNDPKIISHLFHQLLTTEYAGVFELALFAIIKSAHNLSCFRHHFGPFSTSDLIHRGPSNK